MHGGNAGRPEAGVVVLRPVQRTGPASFPFHVPVEGERVGRQTEVAGRPNDRSAKHLRNVVLVLESWQWVVNLHGRRLSALYSGDDRGNSGEPRSR